MNSMLILVRHGESEWNALEKLTGQADVALTTEGKRQARVVGEVLSTVQIDKAYISELQRTAETLSEIQSQRPDDAAIPFVKAAALNELSFGTLTGRFKSEVIAEMGVEAYHQMLKGWDIAAPDGESLETVYQRTTAFYNAAILQDLKDGKDVLVVSHHQVLRTLIAYFENIPPAEIAGLKVGNAEIVYYRFDPDSGQLSRIIK